MAADRRRNIQKFIPMKLDYFPLWKSEKERLV